ncbi:macro domain-containing protein [Candidatus Dependentiae bacterium]
MENKRYTLLTAMVMVSSLMLSANMLQAMVTVKKGSLPKAAEGFDVIVSPDDVYFSASGGASNAIVERAGRQDVKKEIQTIKLKLKKDKFAPCDVISTSGYKLKNKRILHIVTPNFNYSTCNFNQGGKEKLKEAYRKLLTIADQGKAQSIALPFLSAGTFRGNVSYDNLASTAVVAVYNYLNKLKYVKKIVFVVRKDAHLKMFKEYLKNLKKPAKPAKKYQKFSKAKKPKVIGKCMVCLEEITDKTDEYDNRVKFLICGHPFHKGCIRQWLKENQKKCPICKETPESMKKKHQELLGIYQPIVIKKIKGVNICHIPMICPSLKSKLKTLSVHEKTKKIKKIKENLHAIKFYKKMSQKANLDFLIGNYTVPILRTLIDIIFALREIGFPVVQNYKITDQDIYNLAKDPKAPKSIQELARDLHNIEKYIDNMLK